MKTVLELAGYILVAAAGVYGLAIGCCLILYAIGPGKGSHDPADQHGHTIHKGDFR